MLLTDLVLSHHASEQPLSAANIRSWSASSQFVLVTGSDLLYNVQPQQDGSVPHHGLWHDTLHAVRLPEHIPSHQRSSRGWVRPNHCCENFLKKTSFLHNKNFRLILTKYLYHSACSTLYMMCLWQGFLVLQHYTPCQNLAIAKSYPDLSDHQTPWITIFFKLVNFWPEHH